MGEAEVPGRLNPLWKITKVIRCALNPFYAGLSTLFDGDLRYSFGTFFVGFFKMSPGVIGTALINGTALVVLVCCLLQTHCVCVCVCVGVAECAWNGRCV